MYKLEVIEFCLETFFWIVAPIAIIIYERIIFFLNFRRNPILREKLERSTRDNNLGVLKNDHIRLTIAVLIMIFITQPYLVDLSRLITGNLTYVTGYVKNVKSYTYVYIKDKELKLFINSDIKKNKEYKIRYLPRTSRIISGEKIEKSIEQIIEEKQNFQK